MASPILVVRPVDALGRRVSALPKLKYNVDQLKPAPEGLTKPGDTDVYFDGRRSENLVPGVPFSLVFKDSDYEVSQQELVLAEGEEKHLEVRLTKKPKK